MLTINGKSATETGMTLSNYLRGKGYRTDRVAVELNGNIIPCSSYGQTVLTDSDTMEIVQFVGGG